MKTLKELFDLRGRVAVVTGGGGFLGAAHAEALAESGATPLLLDVNLEGARRVEAEMNERFDVGARAYEVDITKEDQLERFLEEALRDFKKIDILINNAARDPKVDSTGGKNFSRLENFPLEQWKQDLEVGLTGAFLCSKIIGAHLAESGGGVIVQMGSDLGLIAPDQRLYRKDGLSEDEQSVKPASYSAVKGGLLSLTRYLATYWADQGVRVNSLSPAGIRADQDEIFVRKISQLIPLGRMGERHELKAAIAFLCSDASSFMNGANLVLDGGRTIW